jgi:long-chain acyl-CoA synthetase
MFHLSRVLHRATHLYGDRLAVSDGRSALTYHQLGERVGGLVAGLRDLVARGDRIALLDRNSLRALEINFACAALGAVLVPLNTRLAAREIAEIAGETEPALFLASDAFAHLLPGGFDAIIWPDADPTSGSNPYEELAGKCGPLQTSRRPPSDIAQIFYTSGTTGEPKGACLTHTNMVASAYDAIVALSLDRDDVWLHAAPMFHLVDAFAIWGVTMVGGVHAIAHFRPEHFADVVAAHRVTKTSLPPTLISMATQHIAPSDSRLSSLKLVSYGGSPMTETAHSRASAALGVDLLQAYGITESSGIVAHQLPGDYRADGSEQERAHVASVGQPTTSIGLRLAGADGDVVEGDGVGEIQISGPRVMVGYWRRPLASRAVLDDGWYATGDLGRRDAAGHLFIVGRKKDMVITGGENVYPIEVENVLAAHPAVAEVAVFGVPSERWGEEVRAAVVLRDGCAVSERDLIEFCRARIGGYKVPKSIHFSSSPLPTTGPGKIAKHLLREEYAPT